MAKRSAVRGRGSVNRGAERSRTPAADTKSPPAIPPPPHRRLKIFSLDPAADGQLETSLISRSVLPIRWEPLAAGPVGQYLEVVDVDPSSGCVYDPVDLDERSILAGDGLAPSTGNPQFHQQMVYAVAMKTIVNFEQVLGRTVMWSERSRDENYRFLRDPRERFVERLRIYPHALRDENAYYSPSKKALLFGYFTAATTDPRDELPGGIVFTCLSHDIVAHETTHAILDGMHRRLLEPSNPDMLAFHEAFADIVAIFQHFTLPGLLHDQIQRTRGDLRANNLLAQLAAQFARSTGRGGALRNALGQFGPDGRQAPPDPSALGRTFAPHERGAILVAAVFDAFLRNYENRVADLRRIGTGGTGVLPAGDIHPDLARRFAAEASDAAQRVLNICIRAIDYLPPVDVNFGDYLRALVTADADFFPDDPKRYRLAFIQSFRDRGIYPRDVRTLAEDTLRWSPIDDADWDQLRELLPPSAILRTMAYAYDSPGSLIAALGSEELSPEEEDASLAGETWNRFKAHDFEGAADSFLEAVWDGQTANKNAELLADGERYNRFRVERQFAKFLHGWMTNKALASYRPKRLVQQVAWNFGVDLTGEKFSRRDMRLEVHAVRPTIRLRPDGRSKVELLVMLAQRVRCQLMQEDGKTPILDSDGTPLTFKFRGGSTLIIDPEEGRVRYAVSKNLLSDARLARHAAFLREQLAQQGSEAISNFGLTRAAEAEQRRREQFAVVHANHELAGGY